MKEEIFEKIESKDLAYIVYIQLKKAITTKSLEPDERIDINVLSEQLGVSRTPIKDAISRLSNEGLVTVRPKKGTYVTPFTIEDMLELIPIRCWLETGYCHEIVNHMPHKNMHRLEEIIQTSEEMLENKEEFNYFLYNELDGKFHEELIKVTGNKKLLQVYRSLNFHSQVARFYYQSYEEKLMRGQEEHRVILNAIKKKDVELFEKSMRQHIMDGQQELIMVKQEEQLAKSHS